MKDDTLKRRSMRDENTQNNKHLGIINQWYLGTPSKTHCYCIDLYILGYSFAGFKIHCFVRVV